MTNILAAQSAEMRAKAETMLQQADRRAGGGHASMPCGTKLNLAAGGFDEPENGKKSTDSSGACYRAHIGGLGQRGPADIARKLDTVALVGGEVLKIISRRADPELVGLLVDDIGRRHPVGG